MANGKTFRSALDWAFAQEIDNAGAKFVLVALAWHARDGWSCFPSQETIARETGQGSRTVRRGMEFLEENGFIRRERRFDEKGNRTSDRCHLRPTESLPAKSTTGQNGHWSNRPLVKSAASPEQQELTTGQIGQRSDWPGKKNSPTESSSNNPSPTGKGGAGGNKRRAKTGQEHPAFAAWYAEYPAKKERGAAVAAFTKAVAEVGDPQILIDGAIRYRKTDPHVARGYIKNPATWLNKKCWLDEPTPLRATGTENGSVHGHGPLAQVNNNDWSQGGPRV